MPPGWQLVTNQLIQLTFPHRSTGFTLNVMNTNNSKNCRQLQSQETELENLQNQVNKLESIVGEEASKHRYRDLVASRKQSAEANGEAKDDDERPQPEQRPPGHEQVRMKIFHTWHPCPA